MYPARTGRIYGEMAKMELDELEERMPEIIKKLELELIPKFGVEPSSLINLLPVIPIVQLPAEAVQYLLPVYR